ncbi:MAG: o-succinylbenzoate synthase [Bacteroidetes bacterium]|nr:o-succinylbenzoate synthase [Bacteroidota bacterium]
MVIKEIKYFSEELIFNIPFQTSKSVFEKKMIFIVIISDELNNIGKGECSPLPEFGTENYEQAENKLAEIKNSFINRSFEKVTDEEFKNCLNELSDFPALRFAIEQAVFTLFSKRNADFYIKLFSHQNKRIININAVAGFGSSEQIIKNINSFLENGFTTIKLKCGRKNFDDDLKVINAINNSFGRKINLRIDINGNWEFGEAKEYLKELEKFNIEYIEQPVSSIKDLIELSVITIINLAADESIKNIEDASTLLTNGIRFLVVKPAVIGGILNSINILKEAERHGANVIFSSSFESPVGKSALVYLASLTSHNFAHGLGVDNLFKNKICDDPYLIEAGKISFDINKYPPEFVF